MKAQTSETQEYLRKLVPPEGNQPPVPAGAYNVAAQLLALESGIDDHPSTARVHLTGGTWLTLRAARIGEHASAGADIAVTIELTAPAERLAVFARACGLTARERTCWAYLPQEATRAASRHRCSYPSTPFRPPEVHLCEVGNSQSAGFAGDCHRRLTVVA